MKMEGLLAALHEPQRWLEQFRIKSYAQAFADYCARYGPVYERALAESGEAEEDLRVLAEALLEGWAEEWKRQWIWNRSVARAEGKQMLVDYLSPMLLELEAPGAQMLCRLLRDGWKKRWPKDGYRVASYAMIQSGFKNAIMGIEIQSKKTTVPRDFFED